MKPETKTTEYSFDDLSKLYEGMTVCAIAECRLATDLVGGQPASRTGVEAFVQHQMKLTGDEAKEAASRILQHEIEGGTRDIPTPEGAELEEMEAKSVNLIRRDQHGPWLGDWMVKACLKNAASRIGLYRDTIGTKGDTAEMGQVKAIGVSAFDIPDRYNANHIYLRADDGGQARTYLEYFKGRVSSPQGSKSIVTLSEVCPAGTLFQFQFRFFNGKIRDNDIADMFAAAMVIGLGSARAFERGKFSINRLTVERGAKREKPVTAKATKEKPLVINGEDDHSEALPMAQ